MKLNEAEQFIDELLTEVWERADPKAIDRYYEPDLLGYYDDDKINFSDIVERQLYIQGRYIKRQKTIHEVLLVDTKIVTRVRMTAIDTYTNEPLIVEMVGIYVLKNDKVQKLWLMSDNTFVYQKTAADLKGDYEQAQITSMQNINLDNKIRNDEVLKKIRARIEHIAKYENVKLTDRQLECLFYILSGRTAKEIATLLDLSYRTIETYTETIKRKFKCSSKLDLIQKLLPREFEIN
ncbi:MAG: helix-turn-helix transcriptional regulator [Gammaproteobacteria bacterium]|nr:helix-turn-helix transcriptional regulator [Gammaproteobacteria bacterium]